MNQSSCRLSQQYRMLIFICKNLLRSASKAKILKSDFPFLPKWGRGKQVYYTSASGPSRRRSCRKVAQDIASRVCDNKYNNCAFTRRINEQHSRRVLRVLRKQIVSILFRLILHRKWAFVSCILEDNKGKRFLYDENIILLLELSDVQRTRAEIISDNRD